MNHDESTLQCQCVKWFRLRFPDLAPLLFAVPNGGARNKVTGAILKGEGVVAGVADLILLVPDGVEFHGMCIEMKTPAGRQSKAQRDWQYAVANKGYRYEVVRSFAGFVSLVEGYLGRRAEKLGAL